MQLVSEYCKQQLQQSFDLLPQKEKGHASRMAVYMQMMADKLYTVPELRAEYPMMDASRLSAYAMEFGFYHDIGKTWREETGPAGHAEAGKEMVQALLEKSRIGDLPYLNGLREAMCYHHECWDGSGVPYGLAGKEIPFWGRLCAAANQYDHLRMEIKRPSRKKMMELLLSKSGIELDPRFVEVLINCELEFKALQNVF